MKIADLTAKVEQFSNNVAQINNVLTSDDTNHNMADMAGEAEKLYTEVKNEIRQQRRRRDMSEPGDRQIRSQIKKEKKAAFKGLNEQVKKITKNKIQIKDRDIITNGSQVRKMDYEQTQLLNSVAILNVPQLI